MKRSRPLGALALLLAASGCESDREMLADEHAAALQAALRRGQFELGCPDATGTILSENVLQPVYWRGLERAEYTIAVTGCGQRAVYVSVCQIGSVACYAAATPPR